MVVSSAVGAIRRTNHTVVVLWVVAVLISIIGSALLLQQTLPTTGTTHNDAKINLPARTTIRPFPMPIHGKKYEIFQPLYDMDVSKKNAQLFLSPKEFVGTFEERISWAGSMVQINGTELKDLSPKEHAALMYIDMIKTFVSGRVFRNAEVSVTAKLGPNMLSTTRLNEAARDGGADWPFAGDTMTGQKRLDNVHALLKDVIENKVIGDYIETGVWRGGSSVLAKAVLEVLDPNSTVFCTCAILLRVCLQGRRNCQSVMLAGITLPILRLRLILLQTISSSTDCLIRMSSLQKVSSMRQCHLLLKRLSLYLS